MNKLEYFLHHEFGVFQGRIRQIISSWVGSRASEEELDDLVGEAVAASIAVAKAKETQWGTRDAKHFESPRFCWRLILREDESYGLGHQIP